MDLACPFRKLIHTYGGLKQLFTFLPDTDAVYGHFRDLVVNHTVSGVKVHDPKIVAAMKSHNVESLLTFNKEDFKRYSGIKVFTPRDILSPGAARK